MRSLFICSNTQLPIFECCAIARYSSPKHKQIHFITARLDFVPTTVFTSIQNDTTFAGLSTAQPEV